MNTARIVDAERLLWMPEACGPYRVHSYTCACLAVYYELVSWGGQYAIHKVVQGECIQHAYAGGWPRAEALEWWNRLLAGMAR